MSRENEDRALFRRRRFRLLTGLAAVGVLVPISPAGAVEASPAHAAKTLTAASDPVADGSMTEKDKALADAQASGQPVEVVSARTESSDTWAQPDGSFSVKRYGTAVRVWRNGAWVGADPTLAFATDGAVVPKAAAVSVRFSGGGTGPMLTGNRDGRTLSLTWPKALPTPTLVGNVATYAEVLPGVDLQLKAEVEGFSQLLVVKNAEAAQEPGAGPTPVRRQHGRSRCLQGQRDRVSGGGRPGRADRVHQPHPDDVGTPANPPVPERGS